MKLKRTPRAGGFAERRYQRGLRSWRAKNRRLFAAFLAPCIVAGTLAGIISGQFVAWSAGMVVGATVALWVILRETPPRYVETWREGAEGERKTEKSLRPLERAGWRIFHDVENGHGNYDHIAVGPSGVYLLDSKNLQGVVEIRSGVPLLRRRHDPDQSASCERIPRSALASAARLKEDIEERTGHRTWVQAAVVFWSEFPEGFVKSGKCIFIGGSRLRGWMQGQSNCLGPADIEEIATGIASIAEGIAPIPSELTPA